MDISVVMPCRNEEKAIAGCVTDTKKALDGMGLTGEIIVVDNASTDSSQINAILAGARLLEEPNEGYGNACVKGLKHAKGDFIVLFDGDYSYNPFELGKFVRAMQEGSDVVVGSRFRGTIADGAMPPLHQYIGNPALTTIFNLLFNTGFSDCHCGFRGMSKKARDRLGLEATGMEFATEMLVNAKKMELNIAEIPINYRPRSGESKMNSFRDGFSNLKFMLKETFK